MPSGFESFEDEISSHHSCFTASPFIAHGFDLTCRRNVLTCPHPFRSRRVVISDVWSFGTICALLLNSVEVIGIARPLCQCSGIDSVREGFKAQGKPSAVDFENQCFDAVWKFKVLTQGLKEFLKFLVFGAGAWYGCVDARAHSMSANNLGVLSSVPVHKSKVQVFERPTIERQFNVHEERLQRGQPWTYSNRDVFSQNLGYLEPFCVKMSQKSGEG